MSRAKACSCACWLPPCMLLCCAYANCWVFRPQCERGHVREHESVCPGCECVWLLACRDLWLGCWFYKHLCIHPVHC
jgi:hypothetical protein